MPRKLVLLFLGACAAAAVCVAIAAAVDERRLAFTLGVRSTGHVVEIPPGGVACQEPIGVSAAFATVNVGLGTYFKPGPELEVSVRDVESRENLGHGVLPAGYPDNQKHLIAVGDIPEERMVAVCLQNNGRRSVGVYSGKRDASSSDTTVNGEFRRHDMDLIFYRDNSTTMLSLVPEAFDRAALWMPGAVRGWVIWVLAALVLLAVPPLLLRALERS